ncbi:MAG: D-tyrosyl-tRNA(Tyr) deacylase [Anaerolineaceae bacterium]|nr:D-tyrosyl-tRNA(Tyr) deacylase [Anaerolineaceae bacterium]
MRAVVQRVLTGGVRVDGKQIAKIGKGLVILLGIGPEDTEEKTTALARKIAMMRIFGDDQGKMNLSVIDVKGEVIVVSQFTLYADTRKGNRPSFVEAAHPDLARPLCDHFTACIQEMGIPVQTGEFGAHMMVDIENDGPVTIWMEA